MHPGRSTEQECCLVGSNLLGLIALNHQASNHQADGVLCPVGVLGSVVIGWRKRWRRGQPVEYPANGGVLSVRRRGRTAAPPLPRMTSSHDAVCGGSSAPCLQHCFGLRPLLLHLVPATTTNFFVAGVRRAPHPFTIGTNKIITEQQDQLLNDSCLHTLLELILHVQRVHGGGHRHGYHQKLEM